MPTRKPLPSATPHAGEQVLQRDSHAHSAAELPLDTSGADDHADRISREEACALLDMPDRLFRRYYLTPAKRVTSTARFGLLVDEAGRDTWSRRLILEHRVDAVRELCGGAYDPPERWADRIRVADAAVAAYEMWERRATPDAAGEGGTASPNPQGDLFAPP